MRQKGNEERKQLSSSQQSLVDSFAGLLSLSQVRPEIVETEINIMSIDSISKCIFGCETNILKTITEKCKQKYSFRDE